MKRVYLDSNVLISLIKSEMGKQFRLMYQKAEDFLYSCKGKYEIVLSDLALSEISKTVYYSREDTFEFLEKYQVHIIEISADDSDIEKTGEFLKLGIHHTDCIHLVLALKAGAEVIITWNIKDFTNAKKLIEVKSPADFI